MPNLVISRSLCVLERITVGKYSVSLFMPSITYDVLVRMPILIFQVMLTQGEKKKEYV